MKQNMILQLQKLDNLSRQVRQEIKEYTQIANEKKAEGNKKEERVNRNKAFSNMKTNKKLNILKRLMIKKLVSQEKLFFSKFMYQNDLNKKKRYLYTSWISEDGHTFVIPAQQSDYFYANVDYIIQEIGISTIQNENDTLGYMNVTKPIFRFLNINENTLAYLLENDIQDFNVFNSEEIIDGKEPFEFIFSKAKGVHEL